MFGTCAGNGRKTGEALAVGISSFVKDAAGEVCPFLEARQPDKVEARDMRDASREAAAKLRVRESFVPAPSCIAGGAPRRLAWFSPLPPFEDLRELSGRRPCWIFYEVGSYNINKSNKLYSP
jgi:hypothetical protein